MLLRQHRLIGYWHSGNAADKRIGLRCITIPVKLQLIDQCLITYSSDRRRGWRECRRTVWRRRQHVGSVEACCVIKCRLSLAELQQVVLVRHCGACPPPAGSTALKPTGSIGESGETRCWNMAPVGSTCSWRRTIVRDPEFFARNVNMIN